MKLKALRLHGFKSFADPTEIEFHEGITAIVGPNGCGKSNISDAIRWVLGEQRPTAIRGARMEEAIFQGSVNRRPVNRASVTLVVSNEDGALSVPFQEVELGRTMYRDGGSDYTINKSSCRLRDLLDLCRDTGLGANAYAIIEGRMIDAILSDRAEERRALFEEAAGIGKYKDRRKSALRRLERAELDLQRLDDLIGEVESKVRSLARQKGKTQRYLALRERRLALEAAVAREQMEALQGRWEEVVRELMGDEELEAGLVVEVQTAETLLETLRVREVELRRARGEAAAEAEKHQQEILRRERELAVASERLANARHRLAHLAQEREGLLRRLEALEGEETKLVEVETGHAQVLQELRAEEARWKGESQEARRNLDLARGELENLERKVRELVRRQAHLEGEAASAEGQRAELARHLERLEKELEEGAQALDEAAAQGDLFTARLAELKEEVVVEEGALEESRRKAQLLRAALEKARQEEAEARDRLGGIVAHIEALEDMERGREGMEPVVKEVLALRDPGVLGPLGDFLAGDVEVVRAVEAFLGPLVQAIVVQDREAVARLSVWFRERWAGRGGLLLLPLEGLGGGEVEEGSLLRSLHLGEPGAAWLRKLLAGLELAVADAGGELGGGAVLSLAGYAVDQQGVVRLGNPLGASGILERRERLRALRKEREAAVGVLEEARRAQEAAEEAVRRGEEAVEEGWRRFRGAEDALRQAWAQAQAGEDRRLRLYRHQEETARQLEAGRVAGARAQERARRAMDEGRVVAVELESLRAAEASLGDKLNRAQARWEAAREEEARLAVAVTREEGEWKRTRERLEGVRRAREETRSRMVELSREEEDHRRGEEEASAFIAEGRRALEDLFRLREAASGELRKREEALASVLEAVMEAERRVREARGAEREALSRRHHLELERQELEGKMGRIRDRLEGEWGRPLEVLLAEAEPVEEDPQAIQEELREIAEGLERLGPVNMLAMEEHEEESRRLEFLLGQREDLRRARQDLRDAIRQINETVTRLFHDTFQRIRENFRAAFLRLFEGGEADLRLEEGADPLEAAIEIHAAPLGKKTQRIDLLSGGERALTALSLLFGIYLVKPSPFCVMDEVDAPLDESNIYRFLRLLEEFKGQSQFIVITHNPRTIEAADWIYGVTMEEPGVSRIVGVRLEDALQAAGARLA